MNRKTNGFKLKNLSILCLTILMSFTMSCKPEAKGKSQANYTIKKTASKDISIENNRTILVYYFHTTFRCYSCTRLEELTKEALNNNFSDLLKTGKIIFKSVNVEEAGNKHFVQDYQLFTKSVVLVDMVKKKQVRWNRLDETWNYLRDPEAFHQYIKNEVSAMIRG